MPHTLKRQELYDLVWSEPMQTLAKKFNLSDSGLAKICRNHGIPLPYRGYWAKLEANRSTVRTALSARGVGMPEEITIGKNAYWFRYKDDELLEMELPPPPIFEETLEELTERVQKLTAKSKIPKSLTNPHRWIGKLLEQDEEKRQKAANSTYRYSWDSPIFEGAFEKRRLRLLNGLFVCLSQSGMLVQNPGRYGRDISIRVGEEYIGLTLDSVAAVPQAARERAGYGFMPRGLKDRMRLEIYPSGKSGVLHKVWQDSDDMPLEKSLREIAEAIIITGELSYRATAVWRHEYMVKRKAELQEAKRLRLLQEEKERRDHQELLEKQRVEYLLSQSAALQQAREIRQYVEEVQRANDTLEQPVSQVEIEQWKEWALAQADRIDPIKSGIWKKEKPEPNNPAS